MGVKLSQSPEDAQSKLAQCFVGVENAQIVLSIMFKSLPFYAGLEL